MKVKAPPGLPPGLRVNDIDELEANNGEEVVRDIDITQQVSSHRVNDKGLIEDESISEVGVATECRLLSVNDADETFKVSLLIHCHFTVANIEIDETEPNYEELIKSVRRYTADPSCPDAYERVDEYNLYRPTIVMVNTVATQLEEFAETVRYNRHTGMVWISYYNTCEITESLELEKFPFDRQLFRVSFKSANAKLRNWKAPTDVLDFPLLRGKNVKQEQLYATHLVACELKSWFMKGFFVEYFPDDDDPVSLTQGEFSITIKAERDPKFYFFNFYFVIYLIVLSNGALVSVDPELSGDRHAITITLLLTLVAFKFVLIEGTPKVGYLTYMDKYVLMSYIYTMAAVVENIVISPFVFCLFDEYVFDDDVECDDPEGLSDLAFNVKIYDQYFHAGFSVSWSLINLAMAIMCFFPSLVRFSWKTVIDGQIGDTEDTVQRTNLVENGNDNQDEQMKRLKIGSARDPSQGANDEI